MTTTTAPTAAVVVAAAPVLVFETRVCSRCGGSGRMPYSVYNGICFKCNGPGKVYTARGRRAYSAYLTALEIDVSDLRVGDKVVEVLFFKGDKSVVSTVLSITFPDDGGDDGILVVTDNITNCGKRKFQRAVSLATKQDIMRDLKAANPGIVVRKAVTP